MTIPATSVYEQTVHISPEERDRLIVEHLPQVRLIASRIHERLSNSFALEDLISTGVLGLIAAIDNYNANYSVKLRTYAEFRIRGAILDSIRHLDGVPLNKKKYGKQIAQAIATVEQRLQRSASEQEIADELGLKLEEYRELLLDTRKVTIGSLDDSPQDSSDLTFSGLVAGDQEDMPLRQLERAELKRLLVKAIDRLPPPERSVLTLYYMKEMTLREISEIMSVHLSRVAQLKTQALLRIRGSLTKRWPADRGIY